MKKVLSVLLSLLLILGLLTGCSGSSDTEPAETEPAETQTEETETEESAGTEETEETGESDGRLGQVIETYFFNFTVNSAYMCDDYHGYTPQDGNTLLVVDIDVENTVNSSIPMFDLDFQAQWGDDAEDAYSWPITTDPETGESLDTVCEEQLPAEYELAIGETINGELVYEVPQGYKDYSISTYDDFSDEEMEGDVYFVYFTAGYM